MMRTGVFILLLCVAGCHHHTRGRMTLPRELPQITREDVVRMLKAGQPEQQIIDQLGGAHLEPPFESWTPDQLVELKVAGATDTVIQEMRLASERPALIYVEEDVRIHHNHPGPINPGDRP